MITIDGQEYRTLEEQVIWLTDNHTAGTYSGSDWSTLTIDGVTKSIPTGGGGESKSITDIIVAKPEDGEVSYSSSDGVVVETTATVQYDDSSEEEISFSYYIPLVAGSNVTMTEDNGLVTIASSGGGSEPSAYIKSVSIDGNTITFTKKDNTTQTYTPTIPTYTNGDGLDLNDGEFSVKVGTGIFFDSNDAVALNAATQQTLAQVATKSTVTVSSSGTATDTVNYITVDGVEKKLPTGGSGTTDFNDLSNRPSYNGTTMTGSTSIPEVKTSTWDAKQDAISDLSSIRSNASNGATAYSNLGNGAYTVAKSVPANAVFTDTTYSAGEGIDIQNNEISVSLEGDGGLEISGSGNLQVDTTQIQTKISSTNKVAASNISGLATVATSGSYADLSNKPTINTYTAGNGLQLSGTEFSIKPLTLSGLVVGSSGIGVAPLLGGGIFIDNSGYLEVDTDTIQARMSVEVLGSSDT